MTEFNLLGDNTEWQKDSERRLHASYTAAGPGATAAEHMLEDVRASISDWTVAEITDAGTRVGYVGVVDQQARRLVVHRGFDRAWPDRFYPPTTPGLRSNR
ncbi:hypothetical protein [Actinomadura sp. 6N118]|uniref:hypothetical protein n=1 Tax=Actinomadura sp. 6N118 TaxID=3375151 RepID=UPI00379A20B9